MLSQQLHKAVTGLPAESKPVVVKDRAALRVAETTRRVYFLDNLRAFVILLVIVLHGSMTYMAYAPSWWYVLDPENSLFFTALVLLIDVPIMLILFFIAGYFALPSLQKRETGLFLKDKLVRIGLPWIFGVLVLAPPTAYLIYYSRDVPVSLGQFWMTDFWGVMYQQSVYWFLGILFLAFGLLSLVYILSPALSELKQTVAHPSWLLLVGFGALMTAGYLLINQFYPQDAWTHAWYLFMFQPLRVPLYFGYFGLGIYAYYRGWFTPAGYRPRLAVWLPLFVISGLLYVGYRFIIPSEVQTTLLLKTGNALLFNSFCLASLLTGAGLFERYFNVATPFWRSQATNSYGIYYVHPLILYPLALIFIPVDLPLFLKAGVVIMLAMLLSWAVSAFVLKKAPLLRKVF